MQKQGGLCTFPKHSFGNYASKQVGSKCALKGPGSRDCRVYCRPLYRQTNQLGSLINKVKQFKFVFRLAEIFDFVFVKLSLFSRLGVYVFLILT